MKKVKNSLSKFVDKFSAHRLREVFRSRSSTDLSKNVPSNNQKSTVSLPLMAPTAPQETHHTDGQHANTPTVLQSNNPNASSSVSHTPTANPVAEPSNDPQVPSSPSERGFWSQADGIAQTALPVVLAGAEAFTPLKAAVAGVASILDIARVSYFASVEMRRYLTLFSYPRTSLTIRLPFKTPYASYGI